jgi:hypothetical protein
LLLVRWESELYAGGEYYSQMTEAAPAAEELWGSEEVGSSYVPANVSS